MQAEHTTAQSSQLDDVAMQHHLGAHILMERLDEVRLLLPYREGFATNELQPSIHPSIIAAFATTTGNLLAAQHTQQPFPVTRMQFHLITSATIGTTLYAQARFIGGRIQVDIRSEASHTLVAQATIDLPTLTRTDIYQRDTSELTQPYYPV